MKRLSTASISEKLMEKPIILTYDLRSQCFCKYIDTFNIYESKF
jgi:hypothetical protein